MSFSLFEHNQGAYEAALGLMNETGKTAIIHPTGTGKSFIGFKLAEEHPQAHICWLSPSENIFKTQLENLKAAADGYAPENISFFTYPKLMLMSDADRKVIRPDFIILDEFHRCGAEQWGKGVAKLLEQYTKTPILGLSATNIRYLDNRRDMADELFDGNVASEMTLGEAIARNILLPPTYIIAVYSYQKELKKYEQRVRGAKFYGVRDAAKEYLEAFRRTLEQAKGLNLIFQKHITAKSSKWLVFCANLEHMREMISHVPEWFSGVDADPNVYSLYCDNPSASEDYQRFNADGSNHLKLLFCVDMLNEGVHVDDLDGVILFRPTISPIIYKQQIGRALSASKKKRPVIFDVVNNFDNLYSIGAIREELNFAVNFWRNVDGSPIVNETFQIIDEARECRRLFEELEATLAASWDMMYAAAERYYEANGDLKVPKKYKTPEGFSLGAWLVTQRRVRNGGIYGRLTEARIAKLDAIGMIWDNQLELNWKANYGEAKHYYEANGNLDTKIDYVTENGVFLGRWICNMRQARASGKLSEERIRQLDQLGMIWDKFSFIWEKHYLGAAQYYLAHGNLDVPVNYVTEDGLALGAWLHTQIAIYHGKRAKALTEEQIRRLEALGIVWESKFDRRWNAMFRAAAAYAEANGSLDVPGTYMTNNGLPLGKWIYNQRKARQQGKNSMTPERIARLNSLGMIWDDADPWEMRYQLAKAYYETHGNLDIPQDYKTESGIWLGKWLYLQRQGRNGAGESRPLTERQIARLDAIEMTWESPYERKWNRYYEAAKRYYKRHGDLLVPNGYQVDGLDLSRWLQNQRRDQSHHKLTPEQAQKLNSIGMAWNSLPDVRWEKFYQAAKRYFEAHGNLEVSVSYITPEGLTLGRWLTNLRARRNNPSALMTADRIQRLNSLGMIWDKREPQWERNFRLAE
jgi:superfamily II DNA or RNA helicase